MKTPMGRLRLANGAWARPRLLWVPIDDLSTRHLKHPSCFLAAASPGEVGRWRTLNRWADAIPIVTFGGEDLEQSGAGDPVPFGPKPTNPLTPYVVDNAPAVLHDALRSARDTPYTPQENRGALGRYLTAVEAVAAVLPPGPVWWLHAESDEGLGAVTLAAVRGGAVALAARALGAMGAAQAQRKSVDVAMRDVRAAGGASA